MSKSGFWSCFSAPIVCNSILFAFDGCAGAFVLLVISLCCAGDFVVISLRW